MSHFKVLFLLFLASEYWVLVHSFDPKEGYPRSKYSKKSDDLNYESNGSIEGSSSNTAKPPFVESDFAMHYECGAQTAENHPWIVVLEHSDPAEKSKKKTLSKGVLIGPEHVLTTVSSIHNSHPFWVVSGVR